MRYRNIDDVARFQDWPLPYLLDQAERLVAGVEKLGRVTPGEWLQIGIESDTGLVGDLAAWVDHASHLAMIGFTIAPEHQQQGYASEGARALLDNLVDDVGVHRIAASIDPRNHASARLLERLGFRYEGCSIGAALVRGEWLDDDRYAMLADEWRTERLGSVEPVADVELVEITSETAGAVARLSVARSQTRFVASVLHSFGDAMFPEEYLGAPLVPWMRAIRADGQFAGFMMVAEQTEHHPRTYLWRLLIDRRFQRRGVGRQAVGLLARRLLDRGETVLQVSYYPEPGSPEPFYRRLGFSPTGDMDGDEVVAEAKLSDIVARSAH